MIIYLINIGLGAGFSTDPALIAFLVGVLLAPFFMALGIAVNAMLDAKLGPEWAAS